jgi:hypothetical protein
MPIGFSSSLAGGTSPTSRTLQRTPTVAPTGAPRQVRQGDYIVTYSPTGAIISRVYSPVARSTQSGSRSESQVVSRSNDTRATNFANQYRAPAQTTKGLFGGSSGGGGALGAVQSVGQSMADNYPDIYGTGSVNPASGTSGAGATGGTANPSANSGVVYDRAFKGISDKQADYMVANPLAIAAKVFGLDMANNPTIAGLLSPVLEAAQNPYIGALMNPRATGAFDQNQELNFAADLLKQYTTPGGSFLSPTMGLRNIQTAMGDPNSALNAVLSTATGEGAAGAASQFDLFQQLMAPLLSMGTGAWGSDIFDAIGYDAYNKYTLGQAATPGLPKQDFLSALMAAYGFPGTLK